MLDRLADITSRRPVRVLLIAAVVSIISLVASSGLPAKLATAGFSNENAEAQKALESVASAAGYDPTEDIVALVRAPEGKQITSMAGRERVADTVKTLKSLEGVKSVENPLAEGAPAAAREAVTAKDGSAVLVLAHTKPHAQDGDVAERAIEAFKDQPGVELGGALVAQHYVSETVSEDLARSEMIAFPLLFLISLIVFRSLFAALLPLLIGAITIPLTLAMIGIYNEITSLSVFALNLTTGLGLGLAIDYALLSITRYREELALGAEPTAALKTTMNTAGRTIVFSAFTVAGAIMVLAIFPLKFLYSMAFAGSTVALASALVSLTVLPAALMLLGPRIDRFSLARKSVDTTTKRWYGLATAVMRRPLVVAISVTLLILVLMLPIRNLAFTSVDASVLPASNQAHKVQVEQRRDFPAESNSTVLVQIDAAKDEVAQVAQLREEVLGIEGVTGAAPPAYLGKNTWTFDVNTKESFYAPSVLAAVEEMRKIGTLVEHRVGGTSADFVDQRSTILDRVPLALLLILAITFVVLFLMTGSVVLPIKTFIMNLLTLGATFGILTWIFGEGHLESVLGYRSQNALEMTQPVLLFVMAFALATDYGVFLLSRIKELRDQGLSNAESVAQGVARTGRVITSAALLFCVAIGAFSLSGIVFIKELGIGTALAVAIDATLIRALLVPSLMALLGEYNWWAPRWMKRLHAKIGFSEGPSAGSAPSGPVQAAPAA